MTYDETSNNNLDESDLLASVQRSVRQHTNLLTLGQGAHGVTGSITCFILVASSLLPLLPAVAANGSAASAVLAFLASLGGNALSGWVSEWAKRGVDLLRHGDRPDQEALIQQLAQDLGTAITQDRTLVDDIAALLEQTNALQVAFDSLQEQGRDLHGLLSSLRSDMRHGDLIQGRLYRLLFRSIADMESRLTHEIRNVSAEVRTAIQAGPRRLTPFVTATNFFAPLLKPQKIFNHTLPLVGRDNVLDELQTFVRSSQFTVAVLPGRGGIGKSKVLQAFATQFDEHALGMELRFVSEGVPITDENVMDVPDTPCLIVVDDAHRPDKALSLLLAFAQQRIQPLKLLLSCRPQGIDHLLSLLTQAEFDPREILRIHELRELDRADVKTLAREALGEDYANVAEQLAAVTSDSPLVTVIGGRLIREKSISPLLLERDDEFRQVVLSRFRDILLGNLGERIDPALARNLLSLLAAVAPIRSIDQTFIQTTATRLGVASSVIISALGALEAGGALLRRGYSVRITPDVLADYLLYEACITPQGQLTGYADDIFETFGGMYPVNVLNNLAELDWRMHQGGDRTPNVLGNIWHRLRKTFEEATHWNRIQILRMIQDVAYYQPGQVLDLVEYAMRSPATTLEDDNIQRLAPSSHEHVLHELPKLLQQISYTLDYLPRCCSLLWELGRDDPRSLNPHPEHAIRILQDLAGYDIDKYYIFNQYVVDAVEQWLEASDVHDHVYSPLDVLDPVLAKTGISHYSEGHRWASRSFVVMREATALLRDRAIDLIVQCAQFNKIKVVRRAIQSLTEVIREPHGYVDQELSEEDRAQWIPEQLQVFEHLATLVQQTTDPLIHISVAEAVAWHGRYSEDEVKRQRVIEIGGLIPDTFELRLIMELLSMTRAKWVLDHEVRTHQDQARQGSIVTQFLQRCPTPAEGVKTLSTQLAAIQEAGFGPNPWQFLRRLSATNPEYASGMCEVLIAEPDTLLAYHIDALLQNIRRIDAEQAIGLAQRAVATEHLALCISLTNWVSTWANQLDERDIHIGRTLLSHPNTEVRERTIHFLGELGKLHPRLTIELALATEIGTHLRLASALAAIFDAQYSVDPDMLQEHELLLLLVKFQQADSLDDYHLQAFFAYASKRMPRTVLQLALDRIMQVAQRDNTRYEPLPTEGFMQALSGISESDEYEQLLRDIRNHILDEGMPRKWLLAELYRDVSQGFNEQGLAVLDEWIQREDQAKLEAAAYLVSKADPSFVFDHVGFVERLLEHAFSLGNECYQRVYSRLFRAAILGSRQGITGQPFPEDVALQKQASEVARYHIQGSPIHRFYSNLAKHAEQDIKEQLLLDEELEGW